MCISFAPSALSVAIVLDQMEFFFISNRMLQDFPHSALISRRRFLRLTDSHSGEIRFLLGLLSVIPI
ncbi:hypothetical protein CW304_11890 [Bacillus sp. UFRGS-B20]|nr:hypothetical protein CW304_11890 [Bacillus sp. UFRGS-B20]